jgi:hypothetical protein
MIIALGASDPAMNREYAALTATMSRVIERSMRRVVSSGQ